MSDEENAAAAPAEEAPPPVQEEVVAAEEAPPVEAAPVEAPPPAEGEVPAEELPAEDEVPTDVEDAEKDVPLEAEEVPVEEAAIDEIADEQPQDVVDHHDAHDDAEELENMDYFEMDQEKIHEEEVETVRKVSSFDELSGDFGKSHTELESKQQVAQNMKSQALGSIISIRRGNAEYFDRSKIPKYMNSYKLDSDKPFNPEKVENILKEVLTEALDDLIYDPDKVPKQAKWASSAIRAKVKEQEYDRYKIVCIVSIGEKHSQSTLSMFRFLWDAERDRFATYVHETMTLFAIGMCFGLYFE